jgi:hypothetical protein
MRIPLVRSLSPLLALAFVACGSTPPAVSFNAADLELENGGLDTNDEQQAFGDPIFRSEQTEDPAVEPTSESEDAAAELAGAKVYYLFVAWGRLRWADHPGLPRSAADPADATRPPSVWDGSLTASSGAGLRVVRIVHFEVATDGIVSATREKVEWKSKTLPHWDGLLLRVVVLATLAPTAPVLTFSTGYVSATIPASELEGLHRLIDAQNANGDKVLFLSGRRPRPCPNGLLGGRWMRVNERGGVFQGRWLGHFGRLEGHVRGIWGQRENGEKVFFGKIIGREGRFIGRLHGRYGDGHFRGTWAARDGEVRGVVFGRYAGEDGRGFFHGRWAAGCAERPGVCQCEPGDPNASSPDAQPPCTCEAPAE